MTNEDSKKGLKMRTDKTNQPDDSVTTDNKSNGLTESNYCFKNKSGAFIGTYEQIKESGELFPDNKLLRNGFRIGYNDFRLCFKSLFQCHNELLNIWTHLLGAIFFILCIFWFLFFYDRPAEIYQQMYEGLQNLPIAKNIAAEYIGLGNFQKELTNFSQKITEASAGALTIH